MCFRQVMNYLAGSPSTPNVLAKSPKGYASQEERCNATIGLQELLRGLYVTDYMFFTNEDNAYHQETRQNLAHLHRAGAYVEEGWDVFRARSKWDALHSHQDPNIILMSGVWVNANWDKIDDSHQGEGCWSGQDFQRLAVEAVQAQFPDSTIIVIQSQRHLPNLTMPSMTLPLNQGHGIIQTCPPDNMILSKGDDIMVTAKGALTHRFTPYVIEEKSGYLFTEKFYLARSVAGALASTGKVLVIGCNRGQTILRVVHEMEQVLQHGQHALWNWVGHKQILPRPMPKPVRASREGDVWIGFTFEDLIDCWGSSTDATNLASYWDGACPADEVMHKEQIFHIEPLPKWWSQQKSLSTPAIDDSIGNSPMKKSRHC